MSGFHKGILALICLAFLVFGGQSAVNGLKRMRDQRMAEYSASPGNTSRRPVAAVSQRSSNQSTRPQKRAPKINSAPPVPVRDDFHRVVKLMDAGSYDDALKLLREAEEYSSTSTDSGTVMYLRGEVLFRKGDVFEAVRYFRQFIDKHPDHPAVSNARAALDFLGGRRV